jgi:hypothetical protein
MTFRRRVFLLVVLGLGIVGILACAVAIIGTWVVGARLHRTTETAFAKIDDSLVAIQDRTEQTRDRLKEPALSAESISSSVKEWAARSAGERLALKLDVAEKSDRLLAVMHRSDNLLELSSSSAESVQQMLLMASAIGTEIDGDSVDGVIEAIASLRKQLGEAIGFVQGLHDHTTGIDVASGDHFQQVVQLALRAVGTLGSIDARIGEFQARLGETQEKSQALLVRSLRWVTASTIATIALLVWMAAGQIALSYLAWRTLRSFEAV